MTRDFKQSDSASSSNQYGISWVLGGVAVGLLAGAVVYALMSKPDLGSFNILGGGQQPQQNTTAQAPQTSSTVTASNQAPPTLQDTPKKEDKRPGFSYHAVLPQLELDVPMPVPKETAPANPQNLPQIPIVTTAEQTAAPAQTTRPQTTQAQAQTAQAQTQAVNAQGKYMFQLGAYRDRKQAVQMQRRAKQNGMNTRVEPAKINGQTWYRVRLGPTDNLQIVNRWKQRLSGMGINPMMIRL